MAILLFDLKVPNVPQGTSFCHLYYQGPLVHLFFPWTVPLSYPSFEENFNNGDLIAYSFMSSHFQI